MRGKAAACDEQFVENANAKISERTRSVVWTYRAAVPLGAYTQGMGLLASQVFECDLGEKEYGETPK